MKRLILVLALLSTAALLLGGSASGGGWDPDPRVACENGVDDDGDGWVDEEDGGCHGDEPFPWMDDDEWNPPPPNPDEYPLQVGTFDALPEEDITVTTNSPVTRCKTQRFRKSWTQATLYNVLTYEGRFRVCYRHNAGIVSVLHRSGDSIFTRWPWSWKGNDDGYPFHIRYERRVEFYFRGTLEFCPIKLGCTTTKHPYITITFYDDNTISRQSGVG
jgi:hypothetical protein